MTSLSIPPIVIPDTILYANKPSQPTMDYHSAQKWARGAYYKNDLKYDFPSPVYNSYSECDMCGISFEFANTRDNESCVSCEILHHNLTRYNMPLPECSICKAGSYYIHRTCGQSICQRCKYNHGACPHCNDPI